MPCRRIEDLDLPGFLEAPSDDAFRSFREHYPSCADCSAEVRIWTELHLELTDDAARHPSPEDLLRLQDDPASLSAEDRSRLTGHLASCRSCLEEVRSMESLAPRHDQVAARVPTDDDAAMATSAGSDVARPPRRGGRIGRVLWSPAFAYAALIAITLPLVYLRRDVVVEPVRTSPVPAVVVQGDMAPPPAPVAEGAAVAKSGLRAPSAMRERAPRPDSQTADYRFALEEEVAMEPLAEVADRTQLARPAAESREKLRALGYAARKPSAPSAAGAPTLAAQRRGDDLLVTVPVPASASDRRPLVIEVTSANGRELRLPVRIASGRHTVQVTLPAAWLGTDTHELRVLDGGSVAARFALPVSAAED